MQKIDFSGFMSRKKISQVKLAKLLGVTQATISLYCKGKSSIGFDKIEKLIDLGITFEELFGAKAGKKLLANSINGMSGDIDPVFEERVLAVLSKVSNSGTIQIGVKNG